MAVYLYCRISQKKQNIERQIRNLKDTYPYGCVIQEAYTGTTTARPQWAKLYAAVRAGDTIAFDSVSRMSRNAAEGVEVYEALYNRGVELVFLKEPYINTEVYKSSVREIGLVGDEVADEYIRATNRVLLILARRQVQQAFEQSEKEVKDLQQRTREGLQTARLNGKQLGAPRGKRETAKAKELKPLILKKSADFGGNINDADLIKILGINPHTFYKYKRELKAAAADEPPEGGAEPKSGA